MAIASAGCTTSSLNTPLSADEHQRAVERGRRFVDTKLTRRAQPAPYKLEHLTAAQPPRIHQQVDTSLFVLSGDVLVRINGHMHELHAGDSVDIPSGAWYSTKSANDGGSSVYFVFLPSFEKHAPLGQSEHALATELR